MRVEGRRVISTIGMIALCTIVFAVMGFGVAEEPSRRKLTLMVYMCGSNLESQYGLASEDIKEMLASGVNDQEVSVLVMTGGSTNWQTRWGAGKNNILEIGNRKLRAVWPPSSEERNPDMNMGDANTLSFFVEYSIANYPAEDYALILWDHGCGPLGGVCLDETFAMDHLAMKELTETLGAVNMEKPLRFIGFDACLMCSLEVAEQVSPYADYMIASQDTEPSSGWEYSFLKGIEKDLSAAETGHRIVDAYLESRNPPDKLTLSCIDLKKVDGVLNEMNTFFASLAARMNRESFMRVSGLRMNSTSFGQIMPGFRAAGEDGYDLVDIEDLVDRLDESGDTQNLKKALSECVVYSRSNEENVHGLSIYHPLANKARYLSEWGAEYPYIMPGRGYRRYVDSFARILTGEELVDWNGLELTETGLDEEGRPLFAATLTQEQAQSFASAQLLILQPDAFSTQQHQNYNLIGSCPADLEGLQILSAYNGNILIADVGNGERQIPVSYLLSADGKKMLTTAVYIPKDSTMLTSESVHALYVLTHNEESGEPEIDQVLVHDEATDTLTSRIPLVVEDYHQMLFWNQQRTVPKGEGILPEFSQWGRTDSISASILDLPAEWHFRILDSGMPGVQLYAALQITDVQNNVYCTRPVPITDPQILRYEISEQSVETDTFKLTPKSIDVNISTDNPGLTLYIQAENLTEDRITIRLYEGYINGSRRLKGHEAMSLDAGETDTFSICIDSTALYGIPVLNSIGYGEITVEHSSDGVQDKSYPMVEFEIPEASTDRLGEKHELLAQREQNGVNVALLDLHLGKNDAITADLLIENMRQESVSLWKTLGANGLIIAPPYDDFVELPGRASQVLSIDFDNYMEVDGQEAGLPETEYTFSNIIILSDHVLQRHGDETVNALTLYLEERPGETEPVILNLSKPWRIPESKDLGKGYTLFHYIPLQSDGKWEHTTRKVVAENSQYQAKVERILVGRDAVSVCFEICNLTDSLLNIRLKDPQINDRNGSFTLLMRESLKVPPLSTWVGVVNIYASDLDEGERIHDLSMTVISREQATAEPFKISFFTPPDPFQEFGTMIEVDQMEVVKTVGPDPSIEEDSQPLENTILLPENHFSYLRWVDSGLKEVQDENFSSGTAFVLRPGYSEGNWEVLSMQPMSQNEKGVWGALFPGVLLCAKNEPNDIAFINILQCDEDIFKGRNSAGIQFLNWDIGVQMYQLGELEFTLDYKQGEAGFTSMMTEGEPFEHFFDYQGAIWYAAERTYTELENGEPDALWNWAPGTQVIGYYQEMDGMPLQMVLRPITEDDGAMILFSIVEKDGKEYSLPMVAW